MAYGSTPRCYILLRDKSEDYPRGELLELNKDGSYVGHSHYGIYTPETIRCDNDGDVAPLSDVEYDLLNGTRSAADCYEVYITEGKLEWGRSLKVGDTLLARLPDLRRHGSSEYTTAIIRWSGKTGWGLYHFGVEIMVSSYVYIPSCIELV